MISAVHPFVLFAESLCLFQWGEQSFCFGGLNSSENLGQGYVKS